MADGETPGPSGLTVLFRVDAIDPHSAPAPPRLAKRSWLVNWWLPRARIWLAPFNQLSARLGLRQWKSTLDLMAGDLTLVMDAPTILGIRPEELHTYQPRHPQFFHRPPVYRYGGPCFARLPGEIPASIAEHFETSRPKLYCAMGVSGSTSNR